MRKIVAVSAAAILALGLTACGDKQAGSPAPEGRTAATGATSSSGPASIDNLGLLAKEISTKSAAKQSAHMTMSADSAGQAFSAEGDLKFGDDPAISMAMDLPGQGRAEFLVAGDAFYVKLPQEVQPGKPWIKIDAGGTDQMSKLFGSMLSTIKESGDPAKALQQVADVGQITKTGTETLDGAETTHYTISVDIQKMIEKQTDPNMKKLLEQAASSQKTVDYDLWLNSDNLPVQIVMNQAGTTMTVKYTDWGKTVTVTAPPAEQIATLPAG